MELSRRRAPSATSTSAFCKAVGLGMVVGLSISLAGFYHRSKLESLQAELLGDISYQESAATSERQRREAAEQMHVEADTEITKLQEHVKELSAAVVEAEEAARIAKESEGSLRQALTAAEADRQKAEASSAEIEQRLAQLDRGELSRLSGPSALARGDRHTPWAPSPERDSADEELARVLRRVAKNNEVMVAISNRNYAGAGSMLDVWLRNLRRCNVTNALVVALDDDTRKFVEGEGMTAVSMTLKISESQKGVGDNHAVSGLKFKILQRFLELGYAVLLSDVDIITLQDPFQHLRRDVDVEAMSDGWDNATAYGYNDVADDPSMGWARYAHSMRVFCFNSGLFYIRPTAAALELLQRVMHRIETEAGWDQAIFNEVIFFPSHNDYIDPAVTRRVMDIFTFMNSKVLFKKVRYSPVLKQQKPATVHVNYHANKHERLLAVEQFWVFGDDSPLMQLSEGS